MGRVLVAGGTGSLGTAVVSRLVEQGEHVVVMAEPGTRINATLAGLDVEYRFSDIRDRPGVVRALRGTDRAYNVAGLAALTDALHTRMVAVNVKGARTFAEGCAEAGIERLVHVSSVSAIGYPPNGEIANESFDFSRSVCTNSYALTKRAGEEAVLRVAERTGLDVSVIVPAAVVAAHSDLRDGWAALVSLAARGRLIAYPPGGLSVCALEDFLVGALAVMERGASRERYIVTTSNLTYADFFALVCNVVGRPPPRAALSERALRALAAAGRTITFGQPKTPLVAKENVDLMTSNLYYDPLRARSELGVSEGSVHDSVAAVHQWLQEGAR